jgi:hypothetical protein
VLYRIVRWALFPPSIGNDIGAHQLLLSTLPALLYNSPMIEQISSKITIPPHRFSIPLNLELSIMRLRL